MKATYNKLVLFETNKRGYMGDMRRRGHWAVVSYIGEDRWEYRRSYWFPPKGEMPSPPYPHEIEVKAL